MKGKTVNKQTKSRLEQCAFDLSSIVMKWYKTKCANEKNFGSLSLYSQFLRSSTSIGANLAEAKASRSDADYKSKICIALSEANEARYWLELLFENDEITEQTADEMDELLSMAVSMLFATKNKVETKING